MSSIITVHEQITGLKLELASSGLTKRERAEIAAELEWLKEQQRIDAEMAYFACVEREAERLPQAARYSTGELPF